VLDLTYTVPFTISQEGLTTIYYRSIDNAGKCRTNKNVTIKIDKTPPVTTASLAGAEGQPNRFTSNVTITLTATDNPVGSKLHQIQTEWWIVVRLCNPITVSDEGEHVIEFYSENITGNVEQTKSIVFWIDKTLPGAEIYFNPSILDLAVREIDNIDDNVDVSYTEVVAKKLVTRTYPLEDNAGNTLTLTVEL
jgi:hypothetical protein